MQKKNILILLSVVVLSSVVGCGNVENTMAENIISSEEAVDVVSTLESTEIIESSTEEQSTEVSTSEVLEETGSKVNYDRGESKGEIIINKVETEKTEVTESNGQLTNTEIPEQHEEGSYYVELAEDGSRKYSIQLITDCMGSEAFEGLTEEEIITVLNNCIPDNVIGDTYEDEAIRDKVGSLDKEWVYQLADKELPSTSTESTTIGNTVTENTNQTSTNQSTSNNISDNQSSETTTNSNTDNPVQNTTPSTNQQNVQPEIQEVTPGRQFSKSQALTHSGESWDGVNGRN